MVKAWMSTEEAAADLGVTVSPGRVRQLLLAGQLRGEKLGRDWMIRRVHLERFKALPPGRTRRPRALNAPRGRPPKPSE
jgi:excisionase family DNA binding protein